MASTTVHAYSDKSLLNTVDVWLPDSSTVLSSKASWIIYIHGGAWRDPEIDSSSFSSIRRILVAEHASSMRGIASINYRLSAYPSKCTQDTASHSARHPDHLNDVQDAIAFLHRQYDLSAGYVLIGHSCGATIGMQLCLGAPDELPSPTVVVGLCGIYDIAALVKAHADQPVYTEFVISAFGDDRHDWLLASPARARWEEHNMRGKKFIIAHSVDDELVERAQSDQMTECLRVAADEAGGSCSQPSLVEMRGKHDEIWSTGHEAARVIGQGIEYCLSQT